MTEQEWKELLRSYASPLQVATEALEGVADHLDTPCNRGHNHTVATAGAGRRGLPPFHEEPVVCDRGSTGCNLQHQDGVALKFSRMAFERIVEMGC